MLAGLGRDGGDFAMREIGRGDHQGIDLRIGAKLAEIGGRFLQPPFAPPPLQQRRIGIARGDKLRPIVQPNPRHMVIIANFPGADQRDPNRFGRRLFFGHIRKTRFWAVYFGTCDKPARVSIFRAVNK